MHGEEDRNRWIDERLSEIKIFADKDYRLWMLQNEEFLAANPGSPTLAKELMYLRRVVMNMAQYTTKGCSECRMNREIAGTKYEP